jgi:hypothetical protein
MAEKTSQFLKTGWTARMICEFMNCSKCAATSEKLTLKIFQSIARHDLHRAARKKTRNFNCIIISKLQRKSSRLPE